MVCSLELGGPVGAPLPCPLVHPLFWSASKGCTHHYLLDILATLDKCNWTFINISHIFVTRSTITLIKGMENWDDDDYRLSRICKTQFSWTAGVVNCSRFGFAIPIELFLYYPATLHDARRRGFRLESFHSCSNDSDDSDATLKLGAPESRKRRRISTHLVDPESDAVDSESD